MRKADETPMSAPAAISPRGDEIVVEVDLAERAERAERAGRVPTRLVDFNLDPDVVDVVDDADSPRGRGGISTSLGKGLVARPAQAMNNAYNAASDFATVSQTSLIALSQDVRTDLAFLHEACCKLSDAAVIEEQLNSVNRTATLQLAELDASKIGATARLRRRLGHVVHCCEFQAMVLLVIALDAILTVTSMAYLIEDGHPVYLVCDALVLVVLSADVMMRFFVQGFLFLKNCLNIFELVLVPLTFMEIFALRSMQLPLPLLRWLRPIFRVVRILRVILRASTKGKLYIYLLRQRASGDRVRIRQDNFDLDMAYINKQIMSMPSPVIGSEAILRNPAWEVARFFNTYHTNKYLLVNTDEDWRYNQKAFYGRCYHFPIPRHGVPSLARLMELCQAINDWLREDAENIVAVHSEHGQGRCAFMVIALLLYKGRFVNVERALSAYEDKRLKRESYTSSGSTLDCASQKRFLQYFSLLRNHPQKVPAEPRKVRLHSIKVIGLPDAKNVDVNGYVPQGLWTTKKWKADAVRAGQTTDVQAFNTPRSKSVASISSSLFKEDGLEKEELPGDMELASQPMIERLRETLEEVTLDSETAGGEPLTGDPAFTSLRTLNAAQKAEPVEVAVPGSHLADATDHATWELPCTELSDAFRIEFHRRKAVQDMLMRRRRSAIIDEEGGPPSLRERIVSWLMLRLRCCLRRRLDDQLNANLSWTGGMMFSCYLHTSFLEMSEHHHHTQPKTHFGAKKAVTVVLDRYGLDKAAFAPGLRSHSAGLQVQVVFEVDQRIEWHLQEDVDAEMPVKKSFLLSCPETSADWLTSAIGAMWPSFQKGFEALFRDSLVPSLTSALPSALQDVKLSKFSLGDAIPKFGPIVACSRKNEGLEVQLCIGLDYDVDVAIELDFPFASCAIDHLTIRGTVVINFAPILKELPVFAALQIFLVNQPTVDLSFAKALEIANYPMVHRIIIEAVNKALLGILVLPNVMSVNWGDDSDPTYLDRTVTFRDIYPCGVLRVTIEHVAGLPQTTSVFHRTMDLHVVAKLGGEEFRTAPHRADPGRSTCNFEDHHDFLVHDERQVIQVEVYSVSFPANITGQADTIGFSRSTTIRELVEAGEEGLAVPLLKEDGQATEAHLQLRAESFDLHTGPNKLEKLLTKARIFRSLTIQSAASESPQHCRSSADVSPERENRRTSFSSSDSTSPRQHVIQENTNTATLGCSFLGHGCGGEEQAPVETERIVTNREEEEARREDLGGGVEPRISTALAQQAEADAPRNTAVFLMQVFAGTVPPEVAAPDELSLTLRLGGARSASEKCSLLDKAPQGLLSDKSMAAIERLAGLGLEAEHIADVLDEDPQEVARIRAKHGRNLSVARKMNLLVSTPDLRESGSSLRLELRKQEDGLIAIGHIPVKPLAAARNVQLSRRVVELLTIDGTHVIELDLEVRLFALLPMDADAGLGNSMLQQSWTLGSKNLV
eukprot:TRINITY_DN42080_c0_g1_i1.p1 TRINITY_DN42080_c0_g1~~TRINITY_DN42080_c0_g1_i1.p1  ORF type:complete len:1464 (-),score=294.98 TRINITY_DN42080_c0_g1_i1:161-4552(-)